MAVSLGFHIVFAALGIGLPLLLVFTEFLAIRRDDDVWMALTRRWSKALGILVALGAVSGRCSRSARPVLARPDGAVGLRDRAAVRARAFAIAHQAISSQGSTSTVGTGSRRGRALVPRAGWSCQGSGERVVRGDRELVDAVAGRVRLSARAGRDAADQAMLNRRRS